MSEIVEYVVVKRTVTVETRVPITSYVNPEGGFANSGKQMTQDEVREYEMGLDDEDAFEAIVEAVSVAEPESITQSCTVDFTVGTV